MKSKNMFGMQFSGTIGKAMTFCMRNGYTYQRKWVKPHDRKSPLQMHQREFFQNAMDAWRSLSCDQKKEYNERTKKLRINGVNLFVREHIAEAKAKIIAEVKRRTKRSGTKSVPNEYPVCGQSVPKE